MKLRSQPLYPISFSVVHNLVLNLTPEGQFQAVRVVRPGKPDQGDFEVLSKAVKRNVWRFSGSWCHEYRKQRRTGTGYAAAELDHD